jgi:polyisoprenyl-phosphate glycosyltransferase
MLRFAMDGIVGFSSAPLRAVMLAGFFASLLAILGTAYALAMRTFTDTQVASGTVVLIGLLFMGGVQLIGMGIVGEYVGRSYEQTKRRPLYFISERMGFDEMTNSLQERREAHTRRESDRAARISVYKERGRATP